MEWHASQWINGVSIFCFTNVSRECCTQLTHCNAKQIEFEKRWGRRAQTLVAQSVLDVRHRAFAEWAVCVCVGNYEHTMGLLDE